MEEEKKRHTVWLNNRAWKKVGLHYRQDNCTTQNEFIEKAILFYCGYPPSYPQRRPEPHDIRPH